MRRGYTSGDYRRLIDDARGKIGAVEFSSDFICGFPTETDTDFAETAALMRDVGFRQVFAFKYSERPGTRAAAMEDDVAGGVKGERVRCLLAAQEEVAIERNGEFIGREIEVLVEGVSKSNPKRVSARSRGQHLVIFDGRPELAGSFARVKIVSVTALALYGERVSP